MIPHAEVQDAGQYAAAQADDVMTKALTVLFNDAKVRGLPEQAVLSGAMMALVRASAVLIIEAGETPTARALTHVLTPALHKNAQVVWAAYKEHQKENPPAGSTLM